MYKIKNNVETLFSPTIQLIRLIGNDKYCTQIVPKLNRRPGLGISRSRAVFCRGRG